MDPETKKLDLEFRALNFKLNQKGINLRSHEGARVILYALELLGFEGVRVVDGAYLAPLATGGKHLKHSWLEYKDWILETDTRQLRTRMPYPDDQMPKNEPWSVLEKSEFGERYAEHPVHFEIEGNTAFIALDAFRDILEKRAKKRA
ncbi:MAG: hypothetical protein KAT43_06110 [Nanoarchaeota archaeon]|nr:hypothetical protein [Nanoarchaeota archaeon]